MRGRDVADEVVEVRVRRASGERKRKRRDRSDALAAHHRRLLEIDPSKLAVESVRGDPRRATSQSAGERISREPTRWFVVTEGPHSLGSGIEEVDRILDGEVVAPVAQLNDAVKFADRGDCFRLLELNARNLQGARGSACQLLGPLWQSPHASRGKRTCSDRVEKSTPGLLVNVSVALPVCWCASNPSGVSYATILGVGVLTRTLISLTCLRWSAGKPAIGARRSPFQRR